VAVLVFALLISVPLPPAPALAAPTASSVETSLPAIARMPEVQQPPAEAEPAAVVAAPAARSGAVRRVKTSFVTAAVDSVGPAVVRIDTERLVDRQPIEGYLFPGLEPDGQRRESGQGSGVILSDDGVILTNAHVVKNAAKVTVTLTDGRTFEGSVKGSDDYMDLAAVKINPTGAPLEAQTVQRVPATSRVPCLRCARSACARVSRQAGRCRRRRWAAQTSCRWVIG
jgi:S1-C subfamily serine protease